nr:hypothetical protein [Tanacetum cinerariifolium]
PARRLLRQCPGGEPLNAQAESLWSRLKTEVLELRERPVFADLADAQCSVADYFDYYNHERLHSSIDYQTPYRTHQQLLQLNARNCPAPVPCLTSGQDGQLGSLRSPPAPDALAAALLQFPSLTGTRGGLWDAGKKQA